MQIDEKRWKTKKNKEKSKEGDEPSKYSIPQYPFSRRTQMEYAWSVIMVVG